ncbi:hypothetical protein [Synoicihabitans lomoniglobus]|uniref:Type IV pilus biogenesis protein PilP n=1 Tax=Synoicihabitans lomoniglobus TaxID=2909285 RepID=A0AAF0CPE4_9BACT|nr:hypothetical protein [Opitutaceae bacterium LMO-M01]WED64309.1 hypothetical protein PXH66_18380 [Opitutaceae bacterium LMO-M01]
MKARALPLICLLVIATVAAPPAWADINTKLSMRQQAVREKISQLFAQRDDPIPELTNQLNPFYRVIPEEKEDGDDEAAIFVPPPPTAERTLQTIAVGLRISGVVTFNKREYIVINETPIPTGGVLLIEDELGANMIKVEEIRIGEVLLSLGSALTRVKFDR